MNIRTLPLLAALVALPGMAAVTLQVPVTDFSQNALTNVVVTLTRLPASGTASGTFVSAGPQTRRTDATGAAWFTNVVYGSYKITIGDTIPREYQIAVGTNDVGTINAVDRVTVWPSALP